MLKVEIQNPKSLFISTTTHRVVNVSTINPYISNNAIIRPADWLIDYTFTFYETCKYGFSFLTAILAKFRAVHARKSYPFPAASVKCIPVTSLNTFCMIFHCFYLFTNNVFCSVCNLCYNVSTYKSPPMGTGGLEPPRQLTANSFQSYRACLLHHAPTGENSEGESLSAETPSRIPQLKRYHNLRDLSIGKTTQLYLYIGDKSKQEVL